MPGCRYGGLPDLPNALPLRPQLPSCVSDQGYVAEGWEPACQLRAAAALKQTLSPVRSRP